MIGWGLWPPRWLDRLNHRRWGVYDQHGRVLRTVRTKRAARNWIADIRTSNPSVVNGWTVDRWDGTER